MSATTPSNIQIIVPKTSRTETGSCSFTDHVDSLKIIAAHYRRSALLSSCVASLIAMFDTPRPSRTGILKTAKS
ncbi:hypothetical protein QT972_10965 [Microcoleus sp. herbarium7]|uniref:hypothetical protein n=1 Tax=Microcoleus sp. herbarium7 TaxID=3055435 RepID=UPI002FCEA287